MVDATRKFSPGSVIHRIEADGRGGHVQHVVFCGEDGTPNCCIGFIVSQWRGPSDGQYWPNFCEKPLHLQGGGWDSRPHWMAPAETAETKKETAKIISEMTKEQSNG